MNASIRGIIDHMFRDTIVNAETRALHEELLNNCLEHYDDLIARGMSETEAIDAVVDSLKGMKEVIDEYPKKPGTGDQETKAQEEIRVPEKRTEEPDQEASVQEKPSEYVFAPETVRRLKTDLKSSDLKISLSNDNRIHVRCEDMDQLICDQDGDTLVIRLTDKTRESIAAAGKEMNSGEFSLKGLMNFLGKAIGSVASSISVSWNVYIELPAAAFNEFDLNSKSGEIEMKAVLPERLTIHSMSGDIDVEAADGRAAAKVMLSAMSGDIDFSGNADQIIVSSMSGDVKAYGVFHTVEMKSTSGDADFRGEAENVRMASVSGDVTGELRNTDVRSVDGSSTSGDVEIDLANGTDSVHTAMSTVSGSTSCRIPDAGPAARLQIRAKSVSGDVTVR